MARPSGSQAFTLAMSEVIIGSILANNSIKGLGTFPRYFPDTLSMLVFHTLDLQTSLSNLAAGDRTRGKLSYMYKTTLFVKSR